MPSKEQEEEYFPVEYDLEEVFNQQIWPLLKTIINVCEEYEIPMVAGFQYKKMNDVPFISISQVLKSKRSAKEMVEALKILMS